MGVYGSVTCMYVCLHVHVYTNRGGAEFRLVSPWCGAETDCGTVGTRSRVMKRPWEWKATQQPPRPRAS